MHRLALSVCLLVPAIASAQPADVKRVLRTFDFEERRLGNPEDLPMHWVKVQGPGLPHYVNGRLATDLPRGGQYSFRFDLNGGGLLYRYAPNQIKVTAGALLLLVLFAGSGCDKRIREADGSRHAPPLKTAEA